MYDDDDATNTATGVGDGYDDGRAGVDGVRRSGTTGGRAGRRRAHDGATSAVGWSVDLVDWWPGNARRRRRTIGNDDDDDDDE